MAEEGRVTQLRSHDAVAPEPGGKTPSSESVAPSALLHPSQFPNPATDPFDAWNAVLIREFFSPAGMGEHVVLGVAQDELDALAPQLGGYPGLIDAVRRGPTWCPNRRIDRLAKELSDRRAVGGTRIAGYRDPSEYVRFLVEGDKAPTYLPILAAVVAVYQESGGGFYQRLRDTFHLGPDWQQPELEEVNALYADLEDWTQETNGRFGVFNNGVLGGHAHVGATKAQGVFRSTDFERLPNIFVALGFGADSFPLNPHDGHVLADRLARSSPPLSRGLAEAAKAKGDLREIVIERINDIFSEWDGETARGVSERTAEHVAGTLKVALQFVGKSPDYECRGALLVEGGGIDGEFTVTDAAGLHWRGDATPSDTLALAEFENERAHGTAFLDAAGRGAPAPSRFELAASSAEHIASSWELPHKPVRVLAWNGTLKWFVERDALPAARDTGCLLLSRPENADHLERALAGAQGIRGPLEFKGLPFGWRIWHVQRCGALEGLELAANRRARRGRAMRFVGGVRVRRVGRHRFLPYDLPEIELEAGPSARLEGKGLEFEELPAGQAPPKELPGSSVRRFAVLVTDHGSEHFEIVGLDGDGPALGGLTLRLASLEAPLGVEPERLGLDRTGASTLQVPRLRGMEVTPADGKAQPFAHNHERISVTGPCFGERLQPRFAALLAQRMRQTAEGKFLDSLVQAGRRQLPYGQARDRLQRYLRDSARRDSAAAILRALRSRGFLEISTDTRGRWTAVVPVTPMVWRLTSTTSGRALWGVAGTLGFAFWDQLPRAAVELWTHPARVADIPLLRLVGETAAVERIGVRRSASDAYDIAAHSVALGELRDAYGREMLEQGSRPGAEVFDPFQASWATHLPQPLEWRLMRHIDPETGVHRLRTLECVRDGLSLRSHLRDERWGTWIAYAAALDWAEKLGVGIAPWPIHWNPKTREVWLPARMRFPYVLERALVAASGEPPTEERLTRCPAPAQVAPVDTTIEGLEAFTERPDHRLGPIDSCYEKLLPANDIYASGRVESATWLRYPLIPRALAELVAKKLGCRIAEVTERRSPSCPGF